ELIEVMKRSSKICRHLHLYLSESKSCVHYDWETAGQSDKYIQHTVEVDLGKVVEEWPHWCFSEDGHFCE
ncbi:hypothetical protein, partial [uncultured Parabacteroides sp.]|uniref:hypothetical protein n=1 Tax=uncultured Parabacteroides sp. TaxID=512312 RepID=UPI0026761DBB